jgi:hypothetical protein
MAHAREQMQKDSTKLADTIHKQFSVFCSAGNRVLEIGHRVFSSRQTMLLNKEIFDQVQKVSENTHAGSGLPYV